MESNVTVSNSFSWKDVNWEVLRKLRTRFLSLGEAGAASNSAPISDYWLSNQELANYDFTFAERIGWKWDALISELKGRGWSLPEGTVLDFGCGTGVAGRRVIEAWPQQVKRLLLWDRSSAAMHFAKQRARQQFPELAVDIFSGEQCPEVLVVSHVLNELGAEARERLLALAQKAQVVLWIEPGTALVSRELIEVRRRLLEGTKGTQRTQGTEGTKGFMMVAPCPHSGVCGLLAPENHRHWCHHFAKVPPAVFQDAGWAMFSKTLEVDLRAIPFSFLVLDRREFGDGSSEGRTRVIGYPRHYKGFDKVLACQTCGVHELMLQKRDAPELFKEMKKDPGSLYEWEVQQGKIRGGKRIF